MNIQKRLSVFGSPSNHKNLGDQCRRDEEDRLEGDEEDGSDDADPVATGEL